jgi:16S rRNA (adenine1518-N6/adenine1519-N6)-dimethyltransferase
VGARRAGVSPAEIRSVLERHGLRPRKDLGQNFLADARVAEKLVTHAGVEAGDFVLEIGCGLGVLTRALAARARRGTAGAVDGGRARRVTAVEIDAGLVRAVLAEGALPEGAELVHGDALEVDLRAFLAAEPAPRRVVANLPYVVSSPLLRRLLDLRELLAGWAVMIQREVAERLLAPVGSRDYGSLTVLHRLTTRVARAQDVSPQCFWPMPQVVSTFLRIEPLAGAPNSAALARVERAARDGFAHRRKTLWNSFRDAAAARGEPAAETEAALASALSVAGIAPDARAESVAPESWLALSHALPEPSAER